MAEKSINLCGVNGIDAVDLLVQKVRQPDFPLDVGAAALKRIIQVEHFDDGQPVITAEIDDGSLLVFQFEPNHSHFSKTAVGQDGELVCSPPDLA